MTRPEPPAVPRLHLPHRPALRVDLDAISSRYRAVLRTSTTAEMRTALLDSVGDVPALVTELDRLWSLLVRTRLRNANLTAAARATLTAARDGDPDPLAYLRDELTGHWPDSTGRGR